MSDVTHWKRGLKFEKSQLVEIETWARRDEFVRYGRRACWGADGKVSIERLCLSLPSVQKPFNSKVIKSFVPELRSRKCFCVLGFLCYLYVRYRHYERFAYRYEYVYFTYSYLAMLHINLSMRITESLANPCFVQRLFSKLSGIHAPRF